MESHEEKKAAADLKKRAAGMFEQIRRMNRIREVHRTMERLSAAITSLKASGYGIKVARLVPLKKVTVANMHSIGWRLIGTNEGFHLNGDLDEVIKGANLSTYSISSYIKSAVKRSIPNSSPGYITLVALTRDDTIVGAGHSICTSVDMIGAVRGELKCIGTSIALARAMEDADIIPAHPHPIRVKGLELTHPRD
jgi:hypothetical protein